MRIVVALVILQLVASSAAATDFDGSPWNISTGNLGVTFIQHSPIGAFPQANYVEPPPSVEALKKLKAQGLVAYEDYIAWGAVEREPGKWDWLQHDAMCRAIHAAGLKYVAYNWVHFPPLWLRERNDATLMRCLEHDQSTNYLSIFDPRTIDHYDHFYRALHDHFGDQLDGIYACILGPYGEGNYPLEIKDWVKMGHCHEGYWCADRFAREAFSRAMKAKYGDIAALNRAWGRQFASFDEIRAAHEDLKALTSAQDRRRWLDFITWYHQAIIDFAERSIQVTLKYFPKEKVRTKPGGSAGGVNPIAWGTYCPGYARMAGKYGIVLQPADCQGAYFADKWVSTAYHFYHVPYSTEPAGNLDENSFVRRMFSDASCGASQFFTYEFEQHAPTMRRYVHLLNGKQGETEVAVFCPTTLYRLGGDLKPTIDKSRQLRDVADYDVLDELLINDGALDVRYKALVIFQADYVEREILDRIEPWSKAGGKLILASDVAIRDVEGAPREFSATRLPAKGWLQRAAGELKELRGVDGQIDNVWTTYRGDQILTFNLADKPMTISTRAR